MIKKTWKKALAGLCAAVMMFSSVGPAALETQAGTFTSGDETWLVDKNNNDMKVRLKVQYNGETTIGTSGATVQMTGDMSSVFNGNTGDGVIFKGTTGNSNQNNILPGDYILVEFEELMNFNAVKVTFGDANDVFPTDVTLSYQTVDNQWVECETGNTGSTMQYLVFAGLDIRGAKAIKITANTEKSATNSPREWLKLNEIEITETKQFEIDSKILANNAKANSEQLPVAWDNDGGAAWAFDENAHWWHTRYEQWDQKAEHEIGSKSGDGKPTPERPIWIQTGFGATKLISEITYLPRQNGHGVIRDYTVSVANLEDATATPADDAFEVVKTGTLEPTKNRQTITLDEAVAATHVRITVTSTYKKGDGAAVDGDGHLAAQNIKIYEKPYAVVKEKALLRDLVHEIETMLDDKEATVNEYSVEDVRGYVDSAKTLLNNSEVTSKAISEKMTELEKVQFVTYRVDDAVLIANAKANSQQKNPDGNDGPAAWAFDDAEHWWHSRWTGTAPEEEVKSGVATVENPIWIQTGFGVEKYIEKITYANRGNQGAISTYAIAVANLEDPTSVPDDADFKIIKAGTLNNPGKDVVQTINLDGVKATHIRLIAYGVHGNNYPVAKRIKIWERNPEFVTEVETTPVTEIALDQSGSVNLSAVEASAKDKSVAVTASVTPANASDTRVVWESSNTAVATITLKNNNMMVASGDGNGTVTSVASKVAVNAVGEGTATITAKSVSNNEVVASFDVNVTGYIHETVELIVGETYRTEPVTADIEVADEIIATAANGKATRKVAALSQHTANNAGRLDSFRNDTDSTLKLSDAEVVLNAVEFEDNDTEVAYTAYNASTGKYVYKGDPAKVLLMDDPTNGLHYLEFPRKENADGTATFRMRRADGNDRYTVFYNVQMNFNSMSGTSSSWDSNTNPTTNGSYELVLLEKQLTASENDVLPGYIRADKIVSGNTYLITYIWNDGSVIVLYPAKQADENDQTRLVRLQDEEYDVFEIKGLKAGTTTVTVADKVYDVTVKGVAQFTEASASLTGTIGLNFYVQVNDADELDNLSVRLTRQKENAEAPEVKVVALNEVDPETSKARAGWYKVTFNVAAKEMTDDVKAEILLNGKTVVATVTKSVKTYAEDAKEYYASNEELVALYDALLNYGAAAQLEFEYREENLASDADLAADLADADFVKVVGAPEITKGEGFDTTKVDLSQVSLLLKEDTVLRLYLKTGKDVDLTAYTVTPELVEGKKYAEVTGISAQNLEVRQTFTIADADGNMITVNYSPLDYAKAVAESSATKDTLKTVAKALYEYYVCAEAYFN